MVTSLVWRSAVVGALSILDQGRLVWFQESHGQLCVWSNEQSEEFFVFSAVFGLRWLDVCTCTDASEEGFVFADREGCRELASEVGRVSERTKFKRSSRSIRDRSCAIRSIAPDVVLGWFKFGRG